MKFAFLFDATQLLEEIEQKSQEISNNGVRRILIKMLMVSCVTVALITIMVRKISRKLTAEIIQLFETLEEIVNQEAESV